MSDDPFADVERLATSFTAMTEQMKRLTRGQKANRHIIRALIVSVALDIILSISLALVVYIGHNNSVDQDNQIRAANITACNLANTNRTEDLQVFSDLIKLPAISAPQFQTGAAKATQAAGYLKLNTELKQAFAPRDCVKLYEQK
jgi:hypothetical protein